MIRKKFRKSCFIIGNGPSVRIADLNRLALFECLVMNKFYLSYPDHKLRPSATFCIDPQVLKEDLLEISKNSESPVWIPRQFFLRALPLLINGLVNVRLFPMDRDLTPIRFSLAFPRYTGNGASVIYSAIQYAVWRGFDDIFFYGLDHKFQWSAVNDDGLVSDCGESNHFIEGYRSPGSSWYPPDTEKIEQAFELAYQECQKIGVNMWNISRESSLDVFPKMSFDEALGISNFCAS